MTDYVSSSSVIDVNTALAVLTDPETPGTAPIELVDMATGDSTPILAVMASEEDENGVQHVYIYTERP